MRYDKLVRDKIPEIIRSEGKVPITHIASEVEYVEKLKEKLMEEVAEFFKNDKEEELADILEIVYAICDLKKMSREELELLRKRKREERGGFERKIILEEVE